MLSGHGMVRKQRAGRRSQRGLSGGRGALPARSRGALAALLRVARAHARSGTRARALAAVGAVRRLRRRARALSAAAARGWPASEPRLAPPGAGAVVRAGFLLGALRLAL